MRFKSQNFYADLTKYYPKNPISVHWRLFILFFIFWKQLAFGDHSSIYLEVSNPKNMSRKSNCSHRTSNSEKKIMHNMKIGSKFLIFPIIIDCWRKTTNLSNKRLLAMSSPDSGTSLDQFFGRFYDVLCEYQTPEEKKPNCSSLARITRTLRRVNMQWPKATLCGPKAPSPRNGRASRRD